MTTPVLPTIRELAGRWSVSAAGGNRCAIALSDRPSGHDHAVEADPGCLAALGLTGVAAWRPKPDGIDLAGANGRRIGFFARDRDGGYAMHGADGRVISLTRD